MKKGIPIRAEIGKRELDEQTVFMARRDTGEKESVSRDLFISDMTTRLESIQEDMLERAKAFRTAHSEEIDSMEEFRSFFTKKDQIIPRCKVVLLGVIGVMGRLVKKISKELAVTIRLIPFNRGASGSGSCVVCGSSSVGRVVFCKKLLRKNVCVFVLF